MSADRERQRERLRDLLLAGPGSTSVTPTADYLLANGVTVELPPEPAIAVGATGTVTLPNRAQYPAIRYDDGFAYVDEHGNLHNAIDEVDAVTFVADPERLTRAAACAHVMELAKRLHRIGESRPMDLSDSDRAWWKANVGPLDGVPDFQKIAEWLEVAADLDDGSGPR